MRIGTTRETVIRFYIQPVSRPRGTCESKYVLHKHRNPQMNFERFWASIELATGCFIPTHWSDHWSGSCRLGSHSFGTLLAWNLRSMPQRYSLILNASYLRLNALPLHENSNSDRMISTGFKIGPARRTQSAPKYSRNLGEGRWLSWLLVLYVWMPRNIQLLLYIKSCGKWAVGENLMSRNFISYSKFALKWTSGNDGFRLQSLRNTSRFEWEIIQTLWLLKIMFDSWLYQLICKLQ
jgi:hypothetical protein